MYNRIYTIIVALVLTLWAGAAAAGTVQIYTMSGNGGGGGMTTATTAFNPLSNQTLSDDSLETATAAGAEVAVQDGTFSQLACVVDTAPGAISKGWTFTLSVNGSDTLSCGFTNTARSCSDGTSKVVASGDRVAIKHVPTATPAGPVRGRCTVRFE
jgi:hypothetical protein